MIIVNCPLQASMEIPHFQKVYLIKNDFTARKMEI